MKIEKAIVAGIEPVMDGLVALEKRVEALQLTPGPRGERGEPGAPGEIGAHGDRGKDGVNGHDGAGIDAPQWEPGAVYRQGAVVTANIGQHFVALKDTAGLPGESEHWARIGTGGFRYRGAFKADTAYADGDLYADGFATFCVVRGAPVLMAGRGAKGERGEPGARGVPGANGQDGSTIIGAQVQGFKLVLVQESAAGIDHIEADFGPAIREVVREELAALLRDQAP